MTIKRPRGITVLPRTEVALVIRAARHREEIAADGLVVTDAATVAFAARRPLHRARAPSTSGHRRVLPGGTAAR